MTCGYSGDTTINTVEWRKDDQTVSSMSDSEGIPDRFCLSTISHQFFIYIVQKSQQLINYRFCPLAISRTFSNCHLPYINYLISKEMSWNFSQRFFLTSCGFYIFGLFCQRKSLLYSYSTLSLSYVYFLENYTTKKNFTIQKPLYTSISTMNLKMGQILATIWSPVPVGLNSIPSDCSNITILYFLNQFLVSQSKRKNSLFNSLAVASPYGGV